MCPCVVHFFGSADPKYPVAKRKTPKVTYRAEIAIKRGRGRVDKGSQSYNGHLGRQKSEVEGSGGPESARVQIGTEE